MDHAFSARFSAALVLIPATLLAPLALPQSVRHAPSSGPITPTQDVLLVRDAWGIPHVFASTDEGAFFGAGWAAAQDRLFQMCWGRLMYQGRVAEFFGPGPQVSGSNPPQYQIVEHDRAARLYGWARHAQRVVAAMDPALRALAQAYANGVNAAIADPRTLVHPFFAQFGIPLDPWTPEDCIGLWIRATRHFASDLTGKAEGLHEFERLVSQYGLEAAIDMLTPDLVYDERAAAVQQSDVPTEVQSAMEEYANQWGHAAGYGGPYPHAVPHFSHVWAVGSVKTTTGKAVLHSDPQISLSTPNALYEWHMRGATFQVRGAGFAGSPNLLVGSTAHNAWGATALGIDQADLFRLSVDSAGHPGEYQLDGVWYPWEVEGAETILVAGDGPVLTTYRECYFGPVVTEIVTDVYPREEYAAKMVPLDDPAADALAGFVSMYRAADLDAFTVGLAGVPWPSFNSVFASADGRVGYWANGASPLRSTASPLGGMIAQDGGSLAYDWLDIVPHDLMPWVIAPADGFVLSANHMPVGEWYPIPVAFGNGSLGDSSRSRRVRELLAAQSSFTPDDVLAVHHDTVQPARRDLAELGLFLRDVQTSWPLSSAAQNALGHLEGWWNSGAEMTDAHYAVALAWFLSMQFRQDQWPTLVEEFGGSDAGLQYFLKTKIAQIHERPAIPLAADEATYVDWNLAQAWTAVTNPQSGAGAPSNWAAWFETSVLTLHLPKWTSLEGFPSLEPGATITAGPLTCTDSGTILSQHGQTYSQNVQPGLTDGALSILPLGISEHDGDIHQFDQQALWETEAFHESPMTYGGTIALGPWTLQFLQY